MLPGRMSWWLTQDDAVTWLRSLPEESVNLFVTDPAYESLEKHRAVGTTTRLKASKASSNAWFPIFRNERFEELFAALYRALAPDSHLYFFCDQETAFIAKGIGESAGFRFWKPLVWDKKTMGMGYHYRARYEFVLFFEKGKRRLNDLSIPDVLAFDRVRGGYPTEKPVPLIEVLIAQSSSPGDIVADPFSGSAATGAAALHLGRHYWGADVADAAMEHGENRLQELGQPISREAAIAEMLKGGTQTRLF